jgi:alpha-beta hydrolase superfamily lysophospholipase
MAPTVQQRSRLLRITVWFVVVLAALTVVGLVFEWINLTRGMPDRGWNFGVLRLALLGLANLMFTALLAAVLALFSWARMARTLPDLQGWHIEKPESEFRASDVSDGYTLDDYRDQEDCVFSELEAYITRSWSQQSPGDYSRFNPQSVCNPETIMDRNWNCTHVSEAANPIGGVLLLHGLSDSPYSLRAIGQRLGAEGYTVVWLRVPGHGTNPRALAEVSWQDWAAAVKIAMQGLRDRVPSGKPLVLTGYSNGGALSLHYALAAIQDSSLPAADAIVLFSPMIGINPLAKITRLYHMVGLVSRNEKAKWSNIFAEIDPFKYSSWPMNANVQAWALTKNVERQLADLEKSGRMNELPPVLAMQSVVDSTVLVPKLITVLFDRLTSEANELFLFDVNRTDSLSNLLNLSFERTVLPKLQRTDRPFRLTVLGNAKQNSGELSLRVRDHGQWTEQGVNVSWPAGVVSLSHVAVPIPASDPVYGDGSDGLSLGNISMRAEPNALMIPSSLFVRCRSNPFYEFMEDRVIVWLSQNLTARLASAASRSRLP